MHIYVLHIAIYVRSRADNVLDNHPSHGINHPFHGTYVYQVRVNKYPNL